MKATHKKIIKQQVVYIPVRDLARAQNFYAKVFDLDVASFHNVEDPSGEKWSIFPLKKPSQDGTPVNTDFFFLGLGLSPHLIPSEKGVIVFLPCDDIEETLQKIQDNGGKIVLEKTLERKLSPHKNQLIELYHAFFLDTEGNKVGLTHGIMTTKTSS